MFVRGGVAEWFPAVTASQLSAPAGGVVCCWQTHMPWHRVVNDVRVVDTGSVGRPMDGDPRAGYVLLDIGDDLTVGVQFVRLAYDVELAARKIMESALPNEFADFLRTGGA